MKTTLRTPLSTLAAASFLLFMPTFGACGGSAEAVREPAHRPRDLEPVYAARPNFTPRGFIPNVGQLPNDEARFALSDSGVTTYFTDQGFVLWTGQTTSSMHDGLEVRLPVALRWGLVGARPVAPVGGDTFPHTVSYFRGNDPAKWRANVPAYRELHYPEILDGVELRVASRAHGFEYSFHIAPRAKPVLSFRYEGITGLETTSTGDLIVHLATGQFTESRPIAFQWIDGERRAVESAFEIESNHEYRIVVGTYDDRHELVVDPVLDWSTSLGDSYGDQVNCIKVDPAGEIVVAGISYSVNLPNSPGFAPFDTEAGANFGSEPQFPEHSDVYVAKFSADGTQLRWAGYLGGDGPTADSIGRNKTLAVDASGDLYITTHTRSPDFPVWPAGNSVHQGQADVSITKITADGSAILWSRLLGETEEDYGIAVALHDTDLYLAGVTTSPNFPASRTFAGMQDAFVAKLDAADGTMAWASFLGGSFEERLTSLAADAGGVIVLGDTDSDDFHALDFPAPTTHDRTLNGGNDAFLTKFSPAGAILWSTYLGGSGAETTALAPVHQFPLTWGVSDIALDTTGDIVVAGHSYSVDFPGTTATFQPAMVGSTDGYVAKLTSDGSQVLWATYLGGSGTHDRPTSIAINLWGEIVVGGATTSLDLPTTPNALKPTMQADGFQDGFLVKLDPDGQELLYSTYIGNNGWNDAVLALDYGFGHVVMGGWHFDTFVPITAGAFQQNCNNCGAEMFLMQFLDAFIAHDGFESGNTSGGQGDWAGNWTASGDVSILTSAGPHSGSRHLRLRRGTGLLQRTTSIPAGSTTLQLGFWSKVHSFEGTEHANVRVRADAGSITTVHTLTAAQSDNTYHYYEIDLTGFLPASQIQITFDANMGDTSDNWYLDDIRITGTAAPVAPIANAGPDQSITANSSGFATVTLNGSGSDPDGGPVNFLWTENSTVHGTSASISPILAVGIHVITLTVTDDEGAAASDMVQVTVNAPPAQPTQSHVGDMDGSASNQGAKNWKATVVVTIHNNASTHQVASGATVTGTWNGGFNGTVIATTASNGQCSFVTGQMPKASTSSVTFTITNVQHASLNYHSASNHDPDGDSNGTSITVNKP